MIPKGIENADAIIEACKLTLAGLDPAEPEWKEVLQSAVGALEEMKTKFFLKTNLAIPLTNACRKDAEELRSLVESKELSAFPEALARFRNSMEKLLKQADMEGITIT
jgi:hypothetical protein